MAYTLVTEALEMCDRLLAADASVSTISRAVARAKRRYVKYFSGLVRPRR